MFVEVPGSLIVIRFIFRTRPYERVPSVSRLHRDSPAAIAVTKEGGRPAFETILLPAQG
jgi:hypothetical protein